jgi:hypothetical protein
MGNRAEIGHWSRRELLVGSFGWLLAACSQGQVGQLGYSIAASGEGNDVAIIQEADAYTVTIHSVQGIGQASVAWWGIERPHQLIFQLHLRGLEQFSLGWGEQRVNVRINSTTQEVTQTLQSRQEAEMRIAPDSSYWMDVTLPMPSVPAYSLNAPSAFITTAPNVWGTAWIDFYRS